MTLLEPTLALRRLCVYKDDAVVFDATFHNGVNIIRGHNSSGKTTILDFIAYALGAENIPWKQEALLCDWVFAEVLLNNRAVTLRRPVEDKPLMPMYVLWDNFEHAITAPTSEWEVYGFRRSASKLSFTQALLLALGLSEAQGDGASNLTMHQLLRVLYADQPSLHSPIFRTDSFDSALNRETIGAYLTGIYDDRLYTAQLQKRDIEKQIGLLEAELRSIFKVLARSEQNANIESIGAEISHLDRTKDEILNELSRLKVERSVDSPAKKANSDTNLRTELDRAKKALTAAQDKILRGELDVADSRRFIQELELRIRSLDESKAARDYFGKLSFSFCPCCLNEIYSAANDDTSCSLCKSPMNATAADAQVLRMRNELQIQLAESRSLITEREVELRTLHSYLPTLKQTLRALERRFKELSETWSSEVETAIEASARKLGAIEQEIKGLYESQRLADVIRQLQIKRDELSTQLTEANSVIESLILAQDYRKQAVQLQISETLSRLLREDLNRQPEFSRASNVQFSFSDNEVSVEGSTQFSESSTVILRHLFHLALLSASTRIPEMRLPRFMILDGIEDGGMELERSYRLQEIIVNECSKFECDFQLIFATSQIAPNLENETYVVARQFSEDMRSLSIV